MSLALSDESAAQAGARRVRPAIAVSKLSHRYEWERRWRPPGKPALDRVSFEVKPGEVLAILGPNGGGKTTLFRILSTMLRPNPAKGGSVNVFGRDAVTEPRAVRQQIGMVFQRPSLDQKLTAGENLTHQGRLYGLGGEDLRERIARWLERFDLGERRHDLVERFSGGMRRRTELAKALLHEPALLLMDEPSTGLDPAGRRQFWGHLQRLRRQQGVTIAFTTHLLEEAEQADRVAILNEGKLMALDTPTSLKARVGGEVVTIEPNLSRAGNEPAQLAELIENYFGVFEGGHAPEVVEGAVRFEMPGATELVPELMQDLPGRIRRISVGEPTLEDVFLDLTGSRLEEETGG
jgi:ABC-2 type transport system ATP-binding protein